MEKGRNKRIISTLMTLTIIFTLMGGTLSYLRWQTSEAQKTNVVFTVNQDFSCAADGGGNIQSATLMPASCTNPKYAIQRTVTVTPTIKKDDLSINMDLWLDINTLGSGLSRSEYFKYALTTVENDCTTGIVSQGRFTGLSADNNDKVMLLNQQEYSTSEPQTYYLYIWIDPLEENNYILEQPFNFSLGGSCTNQAPNEQTVYTVNLYDENATGWNSVWQGQPISNSITTYNTPEAAITALETVYSNANSGATTSLPFFLKHTVSDGTLWCANEYDNGVANGNSFCAFPSQAACNSRISEWEYGNITYTCVENTFTGGVSESYVGFVVTPTMAANNPGMVAGTYYLRGGDNGASFVDNAKTIYDAFGGVDCYLDGKSGGNPYTTTPSSGFSCVVSGLGALATSYGTVNADDRAGSNCEVGNNGISNCGVREGGGLSDGSVSGGGGL